MVLFNWPAKTLLRNLTLFMAWTLLLATPAKADILFEGYSKVLLGGKPIGYTVSRYEFDAKKQHFVSIYYLKTNADGGNITESLKAVADSKLKPLSYNYTTLADGKPTTIDAVFKGDEMTATVKESGKPHTVRQKMPKDGILSTFLAYQILQMKDGLKKGINYTYHAIAEEDASLNEGSAFIESSQNLNGIDGFKIKNKFKGEEFTSFVTAKGEVVSTESPTKKISTELVANKDQAIAGLSFSASSIELLFGSLPQGKDNVIARDAGSSSTPTTKVAPAIGSPTTETATAPKSATPANSPAAPSAPSANSHGN